MLRDATTVQIEDANGYVVEVILSMRANINCASPLCNLIGKFYLLQYYTVPTTSLPGYHWNHPRQRLLLVSHAPYTFHSFAAGAAFAAFALAAANAPALFAFAGIPVVPLAFCAPPLFPGLPGMPMSLKGYRTSSSFRIQCFLLFFVT